MPRHHYVPQFLLRQWAISGQLRTYRWIEAAGRVVEGHASVVECCQIEDLNTYFGVCRANRDTPERDFYTPQIDTPAADVHAQMIARGVGGLSNSQRTAWARFLVAFGGRTPECLRKLGPEQYRRAVAQIQANPTEAPEVEQRVAGLMSADTRAHERNVPLQVAMELAVDPTHVDPVAGMHWWVRRFDPGSVLIGDRPLLSQPSANWPCGIAIDHHNCIIALPIAPDRVFFASENVTYRTNTRRQPAGRLVRSINRRTIEGAVEYIFALDNSMRELVLKRMHGKTESIWPLSSRTQSETTTQNTTQIDSPA